MTTYSASDLAGQIYPIVGAGIGLGLIAGTSRAVMDTMYGDRWKPYNRRQPRRKMTYVKPRRQIVYRPPRRFRWY